MQRTTPITYTLIAITVFLLGVYAIDILRFLGVLDTLTHAQFWMLNAASEVLLPLAVWVLLMGFRQGITYSGLYAPVIPALLIGLVATTPMWLGFWILIPTAPQWPLSELFHQALITGIAEESIFRGFLFGMLFRCAGWHFLPAAGLAAAVFGFGHLYQGGDVMSSLGIFAITAVGSLWFSWLYVRWRFNLWVPIFMHALMNAWWIVFSVDDTALGDLTANNLRALTIGLSIIITLYWNKRHHSQDRPESIGE
jgi:membrane protease YdiL (CAAX protease family)